jgi:uncharacterized protein YkvS
MRLQFLFPILAIAPMLFAAQALAQVPQVQQTKVEGRKNLNRPQFMMLTGRVDRVEANRVILDRNGVEKILNIENSVKLKPNEPITVTGNWQPDSQSINVFSITRANGSVIEFSNGKVVVSSVMDRFN